jgi:hypothetical protein
MIIGPQTNIVNGEERNLGNFWKVYELISMIVEQKTRLRACSYGQKLSRLARKLFDKFTSEISPCYENNMKSYIAFIW